MKNVFLKVTIMILLAGLSACSGYIPNIPTFGAKHKNAMPEEKGIIGKSVDQTGKETNVNITMTGGGEIGLKSMDAEDKSKMSHALDSATGKSTHWENGATHVGYTVTPIKKIVIKDNPFCRSYQVVVVKGDHQNEVNGTACVTSDGSWHTVN